VAAGSAGRSCARPLITERLPLADVPGGLRLLGAGTTAGPEEAAHMGRADTIGAALH
jgi:hypothetical protein